MFGSSQSTATGVKCPDRQSTAIGASECPDRQSSAIGASECPGRQSSAVGGSAIGVGGRLG